ncbi:Pollen Ole e 1 allergen and extensin family protein [Theobroma cacao]|uniref:Pollen Ole e 1 allergen and extensin family protein n=1 Tax=Theobroma cacao TaxID=3641 RepID=A0A061DR60_THECC|nr:Pollen Ole e 1 allergen and extensin family protein [Theobroma cacao]
MALTRLCLAFSLLLLSLLVIASAGDYSNDDSSKYGFDGIPADSPQAKPEEEEKPTKPDYYKPKPVDKEEPDYGSKPEVVKSKPEGKEKPNYGTKQDIYKPKPEEKEKPEYGRKPYVAKPKPEGEEKPYYGTKPDNYKAKPEEKSGYGGEKKPDYGKKGYLYKPKTEEKEKPEYGRKSYVVKPKPEGEEKPYYDTKPEFNETKSEEKENLLFDGVQGLVLCKSGSKYYPIQGALAKITCKAVDKGGLEKILSICSGATDAKGYFFATLSHSDLVDKLKVKDCKAYLESSPLKTCNIPTNDNKGIDGAPLSNFRVLNKKMNLYSVGPFFYTSEAKSATNGY